MLELVGILLWFAIFGATLKVGKHFVSWVAARFRQRGLTDAPLSFPRQHESHGAPSNETRNRNESDLSSGHDNPGQFSVSGANPRISELENITTLSGGEWRSEVEVFQATVGLRRQASSEFFAVDQPVNQPTHLSTLPARVIDDISPPTTPTPSTLPTRLTPSAQVSPSPRHTPASHPTGRSVEPSPLPSRGASPPSSVTNQLPALPAFSPFIITLPFDSVVSSGSDLRFPPQTSITNVVMSDFHSLVSVQSSSSTSQFDISLEPPSSSSPSPQLSVLLSPSPINLDLSDTFSPSSSELSDLDLGSEIISLDDQNAMEGIDERLASVTLDLVPPM